MGVSGMRMGFSKGDDLKCRRPKKCLSQGAWPPANEVELKTEPFTVGKLSKGREGKLKDKRSQKSSSYTEKN